MIKRCAGLVILCVLILVALLTVLGAFGNVVDKFELASHFKVLYILITVILILPISLLGERNLLIFTLALLSLNALSLVPLYSHSHSQRQVGKDVARLKVLQMNLWGGKNENIEGVLSNVRKFDPDVIALSEVTQKWKNLFDEELPQYKYKVAETRFGGIAVYSKLPLSEGHVEYFGQIHRPRINVSVNVQDQRLFLISAHPVIPKFMKTRNGELHAIAEDAAASKVPVIVVGDLNCSPWSYFFTRLLEEGRLVDSELGFGLQPSWPMFMLQVIPARPYIPIDHCLVSKEFAVLDRKLGTDDGSDHLPVYVEVALPRQ